MHWLPILLYFGNSYHICNTLQFYFLNGRPPPNELKERCLFRINQFFYGHTDGLQMHGKVLHICCMFLHCFVVAQLSTDICGYVE